MFQLGKQAAKRGGGNSKIESLPALLQNELLYLMGWVLSGRHKSNSGISVLRN